MLASKALAASKSVEPAYIEDVFSTYLYTGNSSTQTITNGIDLSGKGGLVWLKGRSGATDHALYDTARGATKDLVSNSTAAETTQSTGLTAFSGTGFSLGALAKLNTNAATYASWTFRKQAKFFDVVTYTGTGTSVNISHNLGSTPGCLIIKRTSGTGNWSVFSRDGTSSSKFTYSYFNSSAGLNLTAAAGATGVAAENLGYITSTTFNANSLSGSGAAGNADNINENGATYVAYLFAHDAGGFGLSGTDNVISCGSYTGNGSSTGPVVTLGYEPQWLLVKPVSDTGGSWQMGDVMRDMSFTNFYQLRANSTNAELNTTTPYFTPTATGFQLATGSAEVNGSGWTYIYIAIRRGPMKVPTSGTSVFSPNTSSGAGGTVITTGFPLDEMLEIYRSGGYGNVLLDRLRGIVTIPYGTGATSAYLTTNTTGAEQSLNDYSAGVNNTGFQIPNTYASLSTIYYSFRRAPGFFDVVCYTGTGATQYSISHGLKAQPELGIIKTRNLAGQSWYVFAKQNGNWIGGFLDSTFAPNTTIYNNNFANSQLAPSDSVFYVRGGSTGTGGTYNYVAYLFATCPGVSKVGSYTGSGTTKQIDCGFTAGARFVLIKRTDSTGDWYVWDSARGIVASTDPYLVLNSTAAEVTTTDWVDTYSAGFELSSAAGNNVNINAASYIFLSIS